MLSGRSAAWVWGAGLTAADEPVEITLPKSGRVRRRQVLVVRCDTLAPDEVGTSAFGPVTSPARTAFDLARRLPLPEALVWTDALLRASGLSPDAVTPLVERHAGCRGVRRARIVLGEADPRSESPRESTLRWLLLEAGLPRPVPQYVVTDGAGCFVARLDLAWPDLKVAVEYDGAHHQELRRYRRDLERHNELRALGWVVLQVDAAQLRQEERLVALVRATLNGRA